jgi:3-phosphoshikimate 1-carboxyvinyltransferase
MRFIVQPGGCLRGRAQVPGDKSISHRALMLAAIAHGDSEIRGLLPGADVIATLEALRAFGVDIEFTPGAVTRVHGRGPQALSAPTASVDLGNSGTSIRLLTGLCAGLGLPVTFTGDESLRSRPMRRVAEPLRRMGARIECSEAGTPPVTVGAGRRLRGIDYTLPVASAQLKSAVLLAGLHAEGRTCVTEPAATRDHSERMLRQFGADLRIEGLRVCVTPGAPLAGSSLTVPGDLSSAAFFLVGAAIAQGSDVELTNVGVNPTRTGILECLAAMGASALCTPVAADAGAEPRADLRLQSAPLRGIVVEPALVPRTIDEFPALLIAAACAEGTTSVTGAAELRVKESDRIAGMAAGLTALGVANEPIPDGIIVHGGRLRGGTVDSLGDHRLAMAFAIAALRAEGPIEILHCNNVATSFPGFAALAGGLGLRIAVRDGA